MPRTANPKPPRKTSGAAAADINVARIIARNPLRSNSEPSMSPAAPSAAMAIAYAIGIQVAGIIAAFIEVIGNQRKIRIARGDEGNRDEVDAKGRGEAGRVERRRRQLEIARPREQQTGGEDKRNRHQRRGEENGESRAIIIAEEEDPADDQRPDDGSGLIERLVKTKAPAESSLTRGMRQHRVARRRTDRPSHPLGNDQNDRDLPIAR